MKKIFFLLAMALATMTASAQSTSPAYAAAPLPYATDALEPVISKQTIELHYGKHLQGYANNVNKLVPGTQWEGKSLEEIVATSDGALYNNAGQLLNHNIYFTSFSPKGGGQPSGKLGNAIVAKWGSVDAFKAEMEKQAVALFGSGWTWLAEDANGALLIKNYANGGNPVKDGLKPILGFDVWEHAYYLDYQNRRADHVKALWNIIDWKVVEKRF
ncbi:MAG: superoxide dismutase [Prevotella sp.]|nr:superoxide dismutase [Prevotella sp.]